MWPASAKLARPASPDLTGVDRAPLLAGVLFVEGAVATWGCWDLIGWFEDHMVRAGRFVRTPAAVQEPAVGRITIDPRASDVHSKGDVGIERLADLLRAARERVVVTLRRSLPPSSDDGFVHAALFARRVVRRDVRGHALWTTALSGTERLSDIVLSLFAADMLAHRDFHEAALCVCDQCGRVSFQPPHGRRGCPDHPATD